MSRSSVWIVRIASLTSFFFAGLLIFSAVLGYSQVLLVPFSAIPLAAGIGILKERMWSAYGFALYLAGQLLLALWLLFRETANIPPGTIAGAVFLLMLVALYFFAARALRSTGSRPGSAVPWVVLTALFTLPVFFVGAYVIPSGSMENTLLIGDRILVRRFPRPQPGRGDIVMFLSPSNHQDTSLKRLIGLPGDRVRISNKTVYLNGVAQNETYVTHKTTYLDSYRDNFPSEPNAPLPEGAMDMLQKHSVNGEIEIPAGKFFVLGDSRDNSLDSRYFGFVDAGDIIGKPVLIYDSEEQSTEDLTSGKVPVRRRVRWERFFKPL